MAAFAITQVVLDEASLFNIAVDPAFQRRGLGRQLLQHLIDELIKRDVLTLWLEVRASNLPAIALYEQLDSIRSVVAPTIIPPPAAVKMPFSWHRRRSGVKEL